MTLIYLINIEECFLSTNLYYIILWDFMAARKHQDKILILVKMIYSGQGANLPCFEKGLIIIFI